MSYVTGSAIKALRTKRKLTQKQLADALFVSDKAVSKWETNKWLPDISVLPELARTLGVSVSELLTGELTENTNKCADMRRSLLYCCPICGNIILSVGEGDINCCGIKLPALQAEECAEHSINIQRTDGELYVTLDHAMEKAHYISFVAYVTADSADVRKLYPEQAAQARFAIKGSGVIYACCNRHGLFKLKV